MTHKFNIGQLVELERGSLRSAVLGPYEIRHLILPRTEIPTIHATASKASPKSTNESHLKAKQLDRGPRRIERLCHTTRGEKDGRGVKRLLHLKASPVEVGRSSPCRSFAGQPGRVISSPRSLCRCGARFGNSLSRCPRQRNGFSPEQWPRALARSCEVPKLRCAGCERNEFPYYHQSVTWAPLVDA